MRKALIGLALGTAMVATPALARDGSWYAGLEAGPLFGDALDIDYDSNGNDEIEDSEEDLVRLDTDMGWDIGGILGYDFGRFRLEAEAAYKMMDVDGVESAQGFDLNPATPAVDTAFDVNGDVTVKSLMLNALADFGPDNGAQFFAGGGVGLAGVEIDGELEGVPGPFVDDADSGLAWQLIAGARLPISRTVDLGLKYRYFNVEDLSLVSPGDDRFDTDFTSHSVLASLIVNFGAPPPPPPPPVRTAPPPQPAAPPPPQMKTCPDGSRIPVAQPCPVPPPPVVEPSGERG